MSTFVWTQTTPSYRVEVLFFTCCFMLLSIMGVWNMEQFARLVFYKLSDLQKTERRSEQLLMEMLPAHVLQEFRITSCLS